ncbi:MAG: hypothetical protein KJ060_03830 [Candidatus Hydrogenedentes bacterium]|nr:hypothetical protein [Candidatus Hydrogenedentota bacterium]
MKRIKWSILVVVLAVFGLLTLTANFHVARSKTGASSQMTRASSSNPDATHTTDVTRVRLHVEDRVGIGSALAAALRRHLEEAGFEVYLLNNEPGSDDYPLVLAEVRDKRSFWSPFYATAEVQIAAKYCSYTSDITLGDSESTHFDGSDEQGTLPIHLSMTIDVTNNTVGLVTLPAFRRILVDEPAEDIANYVKTSIEEAAGGSAIANPAGAES